MAESSSDGGITEMSEAELRGVCDQLQKENGQWKTRFSLIEAAKNKASRSRIVRQLERSDESLEFFTGRVDELEQHCAKLQAERVERKLALQKTQDEVARLTESIKRLELQHASMAEQASRCLDDSKLKEKDLTNALAEIQALQNLLNNREPDATTEGAEIPTDPQAGGGCLRNIDPDSVSPLGNKDTNKPTADKRQGSKNQIDSHLGAADNEERLTALQKQDDDLSAKDGDGGLGSLQKTQGAATEKEDHEETTENVQQLHLKIAVLEKNLDLAKQEASDATQRTVDIEGKYEKSIEHLAQIAKHFNLSLGNENSIEQLIEAAQSTSMARVALTEQDDQKREDVFQDLQGNGILKDSSIHQKEQTAEFPSRGLEAREPICFAEGEMPEASDRAVCIQKDSKTSTSCEEDVIEQLNSQLSNHEKEKLNKPERVGSTESTSEISRLYDQQAVVQEAFNLGVEEQFGVCQNEVFEVLERSGSVQNADEACIKDAGPVLWNFNVPANCSAPFERLARAVSSAAVSKEDGANSTSADTDNYSILFSMLNLEGEKRTFPSLVQSIQHLMKTQERDSSKEDVGIGERKETAAEIQRKYEKTAQKLAYVSSQSSQARTILEDAYGLKDSDISRTLLAVVQALVQDGKFAESDKDSSGCYSRQHDRTSPLTNSQVSREDRLEDDDEGQGADDYAVAGAARVVPVEACKEDSSCALQTHIAMDKLRSIFGSQDMDMSEESILGTVRDLRERCRDSDFREKRLREQLLVAEQRAGHAPETTTSTDYLLNQESDFSKFESKPNNGGSPDDLTLVACEVSESYSQDTDANNQIISAIGPQSNSNNTVAMRKLDVPVVNVPRPLGSPISPEGNYVDVIERLQRTVDQKVALVQRREEELALLRHSLLTSPLISDGDTEDKLSVSEDLRSVLRVELKNNASDLTHSLDQITALQEQARVFRQDAERNAQSLHKEIFECQRERDQLRDELDGMRLEVDCVGEASNSSRGGVLTSHVRERDVFKAFDGENVGEVKTGNGGLIQTNEECNGCCCHVAAANRTMSEALDECSRIERELIEKDQTIEELKQSFSAATQDNSKLKEAEGPRIDLIEKAKTGIDETYRNHELELAEIERLNNEKVLGLEGMIGEHKRIRERLENEIGIFGELKEAHNNLCIENDKNEAFAESRLDRINDLERSLFENQQNSDELQKSNNEKISFLETTLKEEQASNIVLQKENESALAELKNLYEQKIRALEVEVVTESQARSDLTKELNDSVETKESLATRYEKKITSLEVELDAEGTKKSELEREVDELTNSLLVLENAKESTTEDHCQQVKLCLELESELDDARQNLAREISCKLALDQRHKDLERALEIANEAKEALAGKNSDAELLISTRDREIQALRLELEEESERNRSALSNIENSLREARLTCSALEAQKEQALNLVTIRESDILSLQNTLDDKLQSNEQLLQTQEELLAAVAKADAQKQEVNERGAEIRAEIEEREQELSDLQTRMNEEVLMKSELVTKLATVEETVKRNSEQEKEAKFIVAEREKELKNLYDQLDEEVAFRNRLETEKSELEEFIEKIKAESSQVLRKEAEARLVAEKLEEELLTLRGLLEQEQVVRAQYSLAKEEIQLALVSSVEKEQKTKQENHSARAEIEVLQSEILNLETTLTAERNENFNLRQEQERKDEEVADIISEHADLRERLDKVTEANMTEQTALQSMVEDRNSELVDLRAQLRSAQEDKLALCRAQDELRNAVETSRKAIAESENSLTKTKDLMSVMEVDLLSGKAAIEVLRREKSDLQEQQTALRLELTRCVEEREAAMANERQARALVALAKEELHILQQAKASTMKDDLMKLENQVQVQMDGDKPAQQVSDFLEETERSMSANNGKGGLLMNVPEAARTEKAPSVVEVDATSKNFPRDSTVSMVTRLNNSQKDFVNVGPAKIVLDQCLPENEQEDANQVSSGEETQDLDAIEVQETGESDQQEIRSSGSTRLNGQLVRDVVKKPAELLAMAEESSQSPVVISDRKLAEQNTLCEAVTNSEDRGFKSMPEAQEQKNDLSVDQRPNYKAHHTPATSNDGKLVREEGNDQMPLGERIREIQEISPFPDATSNTEKECAQLRKKLIDSENVIQTKNETILALQESLETRILEIEGFKRANTISPANDGLVECISPPPPAEEERKRDIRSPTLESYTVDYRVAELEKAYQQERTQLAELEHGCRSLFELAHLSGNMIGDPDAPTEGEPTKPGLTKCSSGTSDTLPVLIPLSSRIDKLVEYLVKQKEEKYSLIDHLNHIIASNQRIDAAGMELLRVADSDSNAGAAPLEHAELASALECNANQISKLAFTLPQCRSKKPETEDIEALRRITKQFEVEREQAVQRCVKEIEDRAKSFEQAGKLPGELNGMRKHSRGPVVSVKKTLYDSVDLDASDFGDSCFVELEKVNQGVSKIIETIWKSLKSSDLSASEVDDLLKQFNMFQSMDFRNMSLTDARNGPSADVAKLCRSSGNLNDHNMGELRGYWAKLQEAICNLELMVDPGSPSGTHQAFENESEDSREHLLARIQKLGLQIKKWRQSKESKLASLGQDIENLSKSLKLAEKTQSETQRKNEKYRSQLKKMQSQMKVNDTKATEMSERLNNLTDETANRLHVERKLKDEIQTLRQDLSKSESSRENNSKALVEASSRVTSLLEQVQALGDREKTHAEEKVELESEKRRLEEAHESVKLSLAKNEEALRESKKNESVLAAQVERIQKDAVLKLEKEARLTSLQVELTEAQRQAARYKASSTRLEVELEQQLCRHQKTSSRLEAQLAEQQSKYNETSARLEAEVAETILASSDRQQIERDRYELDNSFSSQGDVTPRGKQKMRDMTKRLGTKLQDISSATRSPRLKPSSSQGSTSSASHQLLPKRPWKRQNEDTKP